MADIAQIGFAADTSSLQKGEAALKQIVPAAKAAETAAYDAADAIASTGAAGNSAATGLNNARKSSADLAAGLNTARTSVAQTASGMNGLQSQTEKIVNGFAEVKFPNVANDIAANGQELDVLRAKYVPLYAAGQQYKSQLSDLKNAYAVGAINQKEYAAALDRTKTAFASQVSQIKTGRAAFQGISNDAKNLSYQLVDVGQGLLSGQPLFQIFAQQAGQIGQVLATTKNGAGSLFSEIASGIAKVLTPMRLLVLGVLAVAAVFAYLTISTINSSKALDDLSKSIDVSMTKLHGLQQAAGNKGISSDEFASGMMQFSKYVDDAQHNLGTLNGLMLASGMHAKDLQGYLFNVADLVQRTTTGVQKRNILEAAGLPTTQEWVRLMSQGRVGIQAAIDASVKFNASAETNMVQKARDFDQAWNTATTKMSQYIKSSIIEAIGWIDKLNSSTLTIAAGLGAALAIALAPFSILAAGLVGIAAAITAALAYTKGTDTSSAAANGRPRVVISTPSAQQPAAGPQPETQAQLIARNQQEQARLSILGDLATVEQQVAIKQKEINIANAQGIGPADGMTQKILLGVQAQAEQNRVNQQAQVGIFNLTAARKAASDNLQHLIDVGIIDKNNMQQVAAAQLVYAKNIQATSEAAQVAAAPLSQLKQLELDSSNFAKTLDTTVTGALNNLVQPIQDVMNGVTSLGQGFKNVGVIVLQAIQQMVIKMLILAPIAKGLQSIFGGFGIGSLTGLLPAIHAKGAAYDGGVQAFAKGGTFTNTIVSSPTLFKFANGTGMMGEAGPEAIMPLKRGPGGSLGVQMYNGASNDNSDTTDGPTIIHAPVYNLGGNVTQADLDQVKRAQAQAEKSFTANVAKAIPRLRKRNLRV